MEGEITIAWWYNTTWDYESNKFSIIYTIK